MSGADLTVVGGAGNMRRIFNLGPLIETEGSDRDNLEDY